MIITYQGVEFFKVQFGDTILAFNPISKESKLKSSRFYADIALVSANHPDFNGVENLSYNGKEPLVISGPGEYETKGVFVRGFQSKTNYGGKERINTIYIIILEGMTLCFLGALDDEKLSPEFLEAIENIDILFLPIGGTGVIDASKANKIATILEPKIIIPMNYDESSTPNILKTFLKETSEEEVKPIDKLTIKKKDLDGKGGDVVILSQINS